LKRLLAALLLLLAAPAAALDLTASAIPLNPERPGQRELGRLRFLGGLELRSEDGDFGGLSGLSIEGERLLAVSDRGLWFAARIRRDGAGRLAGLEEPALAPLLTPRGTPLGRGAQSDAEGLTRAADGAFVVSFERQHRLWRYDGPDPRAAPARPVAAPKPMFALPSNGGLEAVAALRDGRLLAIAEDARDEAGDFHAWLLGADGAARLAWGATGAFKPTDAAALPNGDVLVLERRFTGLIGGVAGRVALVRAAAIVPGARLAGEEVALLERPLNIDNFEGIAVGRGAGGATEVWLVSDDNFNRLFQRTLLLQFELRE